MSQLDSKFVEKLSSSHKSQVDGFLKFFRRNIEGIKKELTRVFGDEKNSLTESLYTVEEITAKLDAIETSVHAQVHADVDHMVMQCVLYLVQLFLQAEGQGCTIQLDTSQLDDAQLLASLKEFHSGASRDFSELGQGRKLAALGGALDVNLVSKMKDLEAQLAASHERQAKLQEQLVASAKQVTELKEEVAFSSKQIELLQSSASDASSANAAAAQEELTRLRAARAADTQEFQQQLEAVQRSLEAAKAELAEKVQATAQFQQLQKLMQAKNELIKQLRADLKAQQASA